MRTEPTVCIVESLGFLEERTHCEGEIISRTLQLSKKPSAYIYIRTLQELRAVTLYELDGHPFDAPKPLDPVAARAEAQTHFDQWFESATGFLEVAKFAIGQGRNNNAAFQLHQAAEHFYHTTLLVLALYSPKSHKLNFLRDQAEDVARDLIPVWPRDTKFARRCFELLQQAYVNARYSPHYKITREELDWIVGRVELLQTEVKAIAERRLAL